MLLISDIKTSDGNFEVNLAAISRKGHVESASGKTHANVINRNSEKDFKRPSETDRCRDIGYSACTNF